MDKYIHSDHCPIKISCSALTRPSFYTVRECSECLLSYAHYDINRRIKSPVSLSRVNISNAIVAIVALEDLANQLNVQLHNNLIDEDTFCAQIENGIYNICKDNSRKKIMNNIPHFKNCNSTHFKAMTIIHFHVYNMCLNIDQRELCERYLQDWVAFENLAIKAEDNELNVKCNTSWKNVKHDSKQNVECGDWKGKSEIARKEKINESSINVYFEGIFQFEKN